MRTWTIGELARSTGITVRTLHHYDRIGLLSPARRDGSRYREYRESDVVRLQRVLSLRQIGLSLPEIARTLGEPSSSLLDVIEMQIARLVENLDRERDLLERLQRIAERLRNAEMVSADEFITTMEMMTMFEKYYTPEQLERLEKRRVDLGPERIREVEAEWPRLMEAVRLEIEQGTDPSDPRVRALAQRWSALIQEFTGGDPGIASSLGRMYESEPDVAGLRTEGVKRMGEYVQRALAADS